MGVVEGIAIAGLVVSAVSAKKQIDAQRSVQRQQEKAQDISLAQETVSRQQQLRQQQREERVRRARLQTAAQTAGVEGSSGLLGAQSAFTASTQGAAAQSAGLQNTATALQGIQSNIANLQSDMVTQQALGGIGQAAFKMGLPDLTKKVSGLFDQDGETIDTVNIGDSSPVQATQLTDDQIMGLKLPK